MTSVPKDVECVEDVRGGHALYDQMFAFLGVLRWNVSVAVYHKKEVRHAALHSISIRFAEDRQKNLTGELKFCFHVVVYNDSVQSVTLSLTMIVLSCIPFIIMGNSIMSRTQKKNIKY